MNAEAPTHETPDSTPAATRPRALPHAARMPVPLATVAAAPPVQAASSSPHATAEAVPLAKMPAIFVEPDPAAPLTETQKETVKVLQKEFIEALGGSDQDPADPEYFRRWQTAAWESDQRFKTLFGVQAFLARERAANMAGVGATAQ